MGRLGTIALWAGCIVGSVVVFATIAGSITGDGGGNQQQAASRPVTPSSLATTNPSDLGSGGGVARAFTLTTEMTTLQVDQLEDQIQGTLIQWRGPVGEVRHDASGMVVYVSETANSVAFECWIDNPTDADAAYAAALRRGQIVQCKGVIDRAATFGGLVLSPAVFVR